MLILKGEQDMEKLDTAKKSVRKEMYCVLCTKDLEKWAYMRCGVE